MKKVSSILSLLLVLVLLIGCGSTKEVEVNKDETNTPKEDTSQEEKAKPINIEFFVFGGDEYLQPVVDEYMGKNPHVTVEIQLVSNEYDSVLKTKINSGEIPDVFMTQGYSTNKVYKDLVLDITDEDFMKEIEDGAKEAAILDGRVYGIPLSMEAYGFIYNKTLFKEAGITELPKTYSELEEASKKLEEIGVKPFINQYKEWWIFKHLFSQNLSAEEEKYPEIVKALTDGTKKFGDFDEDKKIFDLIDLTLKYGIDKPFEIDYANGLAMFAQGKAAMVHNGTWAESEIRKNNPDIEIGFLAQPVGEDPTKAKLMVDTSALFRLSNSSENIDEVKKLWAYIIERLKDTGVGSNISTIKGAKLPDFQLAKEVVDYVSQQESYPWSQAYWPDGFDVQAGNNLQGYAAGVSTKEEVFIELTKQWEKLANN